MCSNLHWLRIHRNRLRLDDHHERRGCNDRRNCCPSRRVSCHRIPGCCPSGDPLHGQILHRPIQLTLVNQNADDKNKSSRLLSSRCRQKQRCRTDNFHSRPRAVSGFSHCRCRLKNQCATRYRRMHCRIHGPEFYQKPPPYRWLSSTPNRHWPARDKRRF